MASVDTKIVISGDATGAKKAFKETGAAVEGATGKVKSFVSAHKLAIAGIAAGVAAGMVGMAAGIMKATKAAMEQEDAERKLQGAMIATGTYTKKLHQSWVDYASGLQKVTTYGDDAILSAMGMVQQFGKLNDEGMKRLIPSVLDLATAFGMDLDSAAKLVGKTLGGSTNALARYGIEVNMTGTQSEKLASIIEGLNAKFKGQAELMRGTLSGSITGVKIAYGELWESIGKGITQDSKFQSGIKGIEKLLWGLGEIAEKNKSLIAGASLQAVNLFVQGLWMAAQAVLGLRMAWVECDVAFKKFYSFVMANLVNITELAFRMLSAIDVGGKFKEQRGQIWNLRNDMKALAVQSEKEAVEKWEDVKKLGHVWIDLEDKVKGYGKAIKEIPKTQGKGNITATGGATATETVGGGKESAIKEVKDALAAKQQLIAAQRQYEMAGVKDMSEIRLKYLNIDLANATAKTAEWYKLMAEKKELEIKMAEDVQARKDEIAAAAKKKRDDEIKDTTDSLIDFNTRFVSITENAVRAARKQHGTFFKEFGKGLAQMVKQYIRAEILKVTAAKISTVTQETAGGFLNPALWAAILPTMVASAAGIAALEMLIPNMAQGGVVKATPGGTIVRVAEAGRDEAIVPLGQGIGGTNYYTFNISSHLDLAQVTEAIRRGNPAAINMVKQINRTTGAVGGEA